MQNSSLQIFVEYYSILMTKYFDLCKSVIDIIQRTKHMVLFM